MSYAANMHDIKTLILSQHPLLAIDTIDEDRASSVLRSTAQSLKLPYFEWSVASGLMRYPDRTPAHETNQPIELLKAVDEESSEAVFLFKDFGKHLDDVIVSRKFKETIQKFSKSRSMIAISGAGLRLPPDIESLAIFYEIRLPSDDELKQVIKSVVGSLVETKKIKVSISKEDAVGLINSVKGMTSNQVRQALAYSILFDGSLTRDTIQRVIERKAKMLREGGLLEYFPAEDNRYELGGFEKLKAWVRRAQLGFGEEAKSMNLRPPKGILIVGVQGCGKSLAAKVIAREWQVPLLKLDAASLFDKYIGETEKNFKKATGLAEAMSPAVLWIDEIEKAIQPGSSEMDGGLANRLFGQILTWLQEKEDAVFVTATANDLSKLPPELMRKGRFDEIFFVDLPTSAERQAIFQIHLKMRKQDPTRFDLQTLCEKTEGFSGSEIEQVVVSAIYQSLYLKKPLSTEIMVKEAGATVPLSVSRREDIAKLRAYAEGRFVPVN